MYPSRGTLAVFQRLALIIHYAPWEVGRGQTWRLKPCGKSSFPKISPVFGSLHQRCSTGIWSRLQKFNMQISRKQHAAFLPDWCLCAPEFLSWSRFLTTLLWDAFQEDKQTTGNNKLARLNGSLNYCQWGKPRSAAPLHYHWKMKRNECKFDLKLIILKVLLKPFTSCSLNSNKNECSLQSIYFPFPPPPEAFSHPATLHNISFDITFNKQFNQAFLKQTWVFSVNAAYNQTFSSSCFSVSQQHSFIITTR